MFIIVRVVVYPCSIHSKQQRRDVSMWHRFTVFIHVCVEGCAASVLFVVPNELNPVTLSVVCTVEEVVVFFYFSTVQTGTIPLLYISIRPVHNAHVRIRFDPCCYTCSISHCLCTCM